QQRAIDAVPRPVGVADEDLRDVEVDAAARADARPLAPDQLDEAAADGAAAEESDARAHHATSDAVAPASRRPVRRRDAANPSGRVGEISNDTIAPKRVICRRATVSRSG